LLEKIFTVLFTIVLFVVILYLAYLTTKYIGKRFSVTGGISGKNIKVLDTLSISQDKLLMIVKAGEKTVLMGVSRDHMEYICDVDENQLNTGDGDVTSGASPAPDFIGAFKTVLSDKIKNISGKGNSDEEKK